MASNRSIAITTPNGSIQHLTEEQLVIAGVGTELAAASESCLRIARMRAEIGGAQWAGAVAGTAEELGFLADRIHDARRALSAYHDEHRASESAPTYRDLKARKGNFVTKLRWVLASMSGGLASAAAVTALATTHPQVALWLLVVSAFCGGTAIKTPDKS